MPVRYKLKVAYDGTAYAGWQVQPGKRTIQGELERVVKELSGSSARVHCSGRTDSGVHAREQVAHFDLPASVATARFRKGFNALLDQDIRVLGLVKTRPDFHARYDAVGKEYRYHIWNDRVVPPPLRLYRTAVPDPLNREQMAEAAAHLVGRHDFAAFSANPNREQDGTVRDLTELDVRGRGNEIIVVARGSGFLYKMVRSLAGYLIRVGQGALTPDSAPVILESKLRTARVPTAPPQGLFLWQVSYPKLGSRSA